LLGLRESFGELFFTGITIMVFLGVTCMFLLLLLHIIFRRRQWLALGVAWLLFTVAGGFTGRPWKNQFYFRSFVCGVDYPGGYKVWLADFDGGDVLHHDVWKLSHDHRLLSLVCTVNNLCPGNYRGRGCICLLHFTGRPTSLQRPTSETNLTRQRLPFGVRRLDGALVGREFARTLR
jgi:hypothetical protein